MDLEFGEFPVLGEEAETSRIKFLDVQIVADTIYTLKGNVRIHYFGHICQQYSTDGHITADI